MTCGTMANRLDRVWQSKRRRRKRSSRISGGPRRWKLFPVTILIDPRIRRTIGIVTSVGPRKGKQVSNPEMHPASGRERQGKSHARNHERDPKDTPDIDRETGPDPANGNRTAEEGHDPGSMTKAGGSIESPKVEMKTKTKVTTIEGQGSGMPASMKKCDRSSSDLLRPKKSTAIVNRSAFPIMSDRRPRFLRWTTTSHRGKSHRVEESSTAMSIRRVPAVHCCRTTTCGMMIRARRNNRSHCRINFLNIFLLLLHHRQQRPKPLLRLLRSLVSQAIPLGTTTNKPLNLLINLLHRQRFHRQETRHLHPRRTTIICSRPPRKSLPVNTNTRKRHQPQHPVPLQQQYQ